MRVPAARLHPPQPCQWLCRRILRGCWRALGRMARQPIRPRPRANRLRRHRHSGHPALSEWRRNGPGPAWLPRPRKRRHWPGSSSAHPSIPRCRPRMPPRPGRQERPRPWSRCRRRLPSWWRRRWFLRWLFFRRRSPLPGQPRDPWPSPPPLRRQERRTIRPHWRNLPLNLASSCRAGPCPRKGRQSRNPRSAHRQTLPKGVTPWCWA